MATVEHIVSDPNQHGGKPYIAGRGITVHYIAQLFNLDWTAEDLIEQFELTPGQAYAAVSYYLDHKSEIDQENEQSARETEALLEELTRQGKAESATAFRARIEKRKSNT